MGERLDGTVALVTGASSGIGEATARALAAHGAAVAVVARRKDRLEELVTRIGDAGGRALAIEADVTVQEQAIAVVERTVSELGSLDTLVNNAGVMLLGPIVDAPTEEWDRMIKLNVLGLFYCSHAALPHLLAAVGDSQRGVADIVNISSVAGRLARMGLGVYNASEWAVGAFTESLRQEVTQRNVRVSVVEPGAVDTELTDHLREEIKAVAAARFDGVEKLHADDIADAIAYIVTQPRRVAINEVLIRPTDQQA